MTTPTRARTRGPCSTTQPGSTQRNPRLVRRTAGYSHTARTRKSAPGATTSNTHQESKDKFRRDRRVAPDRGDDSTAIVPGRTVAETALADARVKSRKANVAEIAAFVRTAGGTAGVGGVAADALYGQTNRNDLSTSEGRCEDKTGSG